MKRLGGLWNKKSKTNGKSYLSGTLEYLPGMPVNIIIMKNDNKKPGSKQPDFVLLLQDKREEGKHEGSIKVTEEHFM